MRRFIQFIETNDHEGERWCRWLQYDGNLETLEALDDLITDHGLLEEYSTNWECIVSEDVVDTMVAYGNFDYGYDHAHVKIVGILDIQKIVDAIQDVEDGDDESQIVDSFLYKRGIEDMFRTTT